MLRLLWHGHQYLSGHSGILWRNIVWMFSLHLNDRLRFEGRIYSQWTMGGLAYRPHGPAHYHNEQRSQGRSMHPGKLPRPAAKHLVALCKFGVPERNSTLWADWGVSTDWPSEVWPIAWEIVTWRQHDHIWSYFGIGVPNSGVCANVS